MTIREKINTLTAILNIDAVAETVDAETMSELKGFLASRIAQLDTKAEKAAVRRAEKVKEDPMKDVIAGLLTNEYQSVADFLPALGEDATKGKVVSRLTKLVNEGVAVKETAKGENGAKFMVYKLAE